MYRIYFEMAPLQRPHKDMPIYSNYIVTTRVLWPKAAPPVLCTASEYVAIVLACPCAATHQKYMQWPRRPHVCPRKERLQFSNRTMKFAAAAAVDVKSCLQILQSPRMMHTHASQATIELPLSNTIGLRAELFESRFCVLVHRTLASGLQDTEMRRHGKLWTNDLIYTSLYMCRMSSKPMKKKPFLKRKTIICLGE